MFSSIDIKVKKLSDKIGQEIPEPAYATAGSAALDLCACLEKSLYIPVAQRVKIPTGLAFQLPNNIVGLIFSRSGQGWKNGITLANSVGVLDSDYTGELQIILQNNGHEDFQINPGDRIAQIAFLPVFNANLTYVEQLEKTGERRGRIWFYRRLRERAIFSHIHLLIHIDIYKPVRRCGK